MCSVPSAQPVPAGDAQRYLDVQSEIGQKTRVFEEMCKLRIQTQINEPLEICEPSYNPLIAEFSDKCKWDSFASNMGTGDMLQGEGIHKLAGTETIADAGIVVYVIMQDCVFSGYL